MAQVEVDRAKLQSSPDPKNVGSPVAQGRSRKRKNPAPERIGFEDVSLDGIGGLSDGVDTSDDEQGDIHNDLNMECVNVDEQRELSSYADEDADSPLPELTPDTFQPPYPPYEITKPAKPKKSYYKPSGRPRGRPRKDPSQLAKNLKPKRQRGRPSTKNKVFNPHPPILIAPRPEADIVVVSPINGSVAVTENSSSSTTVSSTPSANTTTTTLAQGFQSEPPVKPKKKSYYVPRGRPRGRPPTISSDSPRGPTSSMLTHTQSPMAGGLPTMVQLEPQMPPFLNEYLNSPESATSGIVRDAQPVRRGRGRPRIRPMPPPGTPKRGRGRPRIHHKAEDVIEKNLELQEEIQRLEDLVRKKDTIINRLRKQLGRLGETESDAELANDGDSSGGSQTQRFVYMNSDGSYNQPPESDMGDSSHDHESSGYHGNTLSQPIETQQGTNAQSGESLAADEDHNGHHTNDMDHNGYHDDHIVHDDPPAPFEIKPQGDLHADLSLLDA